MKKLAALFALAVFAVAPALLACDSEKHGEAHADGKSCATAHAASKECPMKGNETAKSEVEMTGKVVCMHCNLKKESECRKVFQSSKDETLVNICPETDMKAIEAISEHGEALLVVKGEMCKAKDGSAMLKIASAQKAPKPAA